ncbi:MAG: hypothetical protein HOJ73_04490 [Nitrosomonadales bacterium]|nr:hypothetical protein [Nitrosomonadales bacterium]
MIWLDITGGKKSERSKVEDAFWFALSKLMPRKQNLDVTINLTSLKDADGYCHGIPGGEYEIEVKKGQSYPDLITTVFHEMVHVRQAERGQLIDSGFTKTWEGTDYISIFSTIDEYRNLPWEAEAYRLQEELLVKWKKNTK